MNQVKDYLSQIRSINNKIRNIRAEIDELREAAMSQSSKLDPDRIRTDSPVLVAIS